MPSYADITIQAIDNDSNQLFSYSVPFEFEINVQQLLERAFVLEQTTSNPDPFVYTVEYFGYSEFEGFPGYLGYEIERIQDLSSNDDFFWQLQVNGAVSSTGADTTFPNPGATVTWQYTSTSAPGLHARTKAIHARRARRQRKR